MPLPLIVAGIAGLAMAGKVASDMDEAKKYANWAKEEADEGNEYLEKAKEYQEDIEYYIDSASRIVRSAKENGIKILIKNFVHFKDIDLKNDKYSLLIKQIEDDIRRYNLEISMDDIFSINANIRTIANKLGINISKFETSKELVEDVGIETAAGLMTHGILAAGIGGVGALLGAEFVMATGVGAIVLAPVVLAVSSDKVKEAKNAYYEAKDFKNEALAEKEKWRGILEYIYMFHDVASYYDDFLSSTVDVSNFWLKKYLTELKELETVDNVISNSPAIVAKNIITLAYLNKFVQYEYISNREAGDLDNLIDWIKWNAEDEMDKFNKLEREIKAIKNN